MSIAATSLVTHPYVPDAVAYLLDMTSVDQRDMEGFGKWYHDMLELAVFGTEEEPIILDE